MSRFIWLALFVVTLFAGCKALEDFGDNTWPQVKPVVQGVGDAGAPATGGISALVASLIVGYIVPGVLLANKWWLAKQRGEALHAINLAPGTPSAVDQAKAGGASLGAVKAASKAAA